MDFTTIEVLPHQADFIESKERHTGLIAGYGSGKTLAGVYKTTIKKLKYPGIPVAYYLPTYGLIEDIAYPRFEEVFTAIGLSYQLNKSKHEFITPYGKFILRSLQNPERIVGYEVGYSLIDEADILETEKMTKVFKKILARNRKKLPNEDMNCLDVVSTPEGFKWAYNFFVKEAKDGRKIVKGKTQDNPFLPDDYIDSLMESHTENELLAYLGGEFVNLTSGNVYHTFDRFKNHSERVIKPTDVLHIGMDFNVTNMHAVIHVTDYKILTAVDEICKAYDTADMIRIIKERYPKRSIVIYPDASGDNRKTSGSDTDILLLKKAGFKIEVDDSNPSVKDRITTVNAGFLDGNGNISYYINTKTCPVYTEGLEKIAYKKGAPDKEGGFDHVTEAGGYCAYKHLKLKKSKSFKVRNHD